MTKYFSFFALLLLCSCAEAPTKFDRNNLNDPDNIEYELAPPSAFDSEILADKLIKLSWGNSSEHDLATAFILSKTVGSNSDIIVLDTLDKSLNAYVDSSKLITINTMYHLERIRSTKDSVIKSETLHTDIDFGNPFSKYGVVCCKSYEDSESTSLETTPDPDSLKAYFTWDYETDWPFISIAYSSTEGINHFEVIDTLLPGQKYYESPDFDLDFQNRKFLIRSFVSELDIEENIVADSIIAEYSALEKFSPHMLEPDVRHESKTVITWEDNSDFEDSFEILRGYNRNSQSVIATVNPGINTFTDTLQPFLPQAGTSGGVYYKDYRTFYSVRAIKDNTSASTDTTQAEIRIYVADLLLKDSDQNSITLQWEPREPSGIHSYTLLRSTDRDNFTPYKKFNSSQDTYTDTDLDTSETYHYRIKSDIKNGFGNPIVSHSYEFEQLSTFDFENATVLEVSNNDNYLIAASGYDADPSSNAHELVIYDLNSNSEFNRINPFNSPIDGIDILEEKNLIAYSTKEAKKFEVRDFIADTTVFSISEIEVHDIEFSPDGLSVYVVSELSNFRKYSFDSTDPDFEVQSTDQFYTFPSKRRISVSKTGDTVAVNMASKYHLYTDQGERISFNSLSTQGNTSDWVNISSKGDFIASTREYANTTITQVQSLETGAELFHLGGIVSALDFNHNDQLALVTTFEDVYLIDLNTLRPVGAYNFTDDRSDEGITFSRMSNTDNTFFIANSQGIQKMRITSTRKWQPAPYQLSISPYY
ncbi:hypothetical protein [Gracilimonas sp.]|uniref:hypothetical protein n=1 Tax=Gracilimonas sp. TaxID=1974203 RepID=UPI003BAD8CEC